MINAFVKATFNEFTLNFPEPAPEEVLKSVQNLAYEAALELDAQRRTIEKAAAREARRTRQRLEARVAGGFRICPIVQSRPNNIPESTRPQRRRKKLGRS